MSVFFVILSLASLCAVFGQQPLEKCTGVTNPEEAVFVEDWDNGCGAFVTCYNNQAYRSVCPFELSFNPLSESCDEPETVACFQPPDEVRCPSFGTFLVPYPYLCSRYIRCVNGFQEELSCPTDQIFDIEAGRCLSRSEARCRREAQICPPSVSPIDLFFIPSTRDCGR